MISESFFDFPDPSSRSGSSGSGPRPWHPPISLGSQRWTLARTPAVRIELFGFVVGTDGFGFYIRLDWSDPEHELARNVFDVSLEAGEPIPDALPDSMLRFGIRFSDGSKSTNVDGKWALGAPQPPPVLYPGRWSMNGLYGTQPFWVWPLPPPGPVTFVWQWPLEELELMSKQIDARFILPR